MWRYLILNSLWFAILFLVQFFGSRRSRDFVFLAALGAGFFMATRSFVDPFAWGAYFVFSLIVFSGAGQFKAWALTRQEVLMQELESFSRKLEAEHAWLRRTSEETQTIGKQADEISYLCEKIKEMSKTLNKLEAFLVFGEALSKNFKFDCMKLVLFGESQPAASRSESAEEVYQLLYSDFQGFFDRSRILKDADRVRGKLFEFDKRILGSILKDPKSLRKPDDSAQRSSRRGLGFAEEGAPFMAHPIFIQQEIVGVLILIGLDAEDFQIFSILTESFIAEIQRIRLFERVQTLALTDGLTGVSVRRHLLARLEGELERSSRLGLKLSFLMIDIDDFKHFNDQYGHLVGDVILKEVADTLKKNIREVDLAGRYGGEEFGVFLTETDESGAFFVAERIRRALAEKDYKAFDENLKVTVSIGCSTYTPAAGGGDSLVETADAALYEAKRLGKNRVHVSNVDNP